jgi:small-conductance mechanosensitive channel
MLIQSWATAIQQSFQEVWTNFVTFVPQILVAAVIFVIGWIVGSILGRVVAQVVDALKVDSALKSAGVDDALARGGFRLNAGMLLGGLVKWFVVLVFLVAALDVLGLSQVNTFLYEVVLLYIPQVIVAVLILLLAAVIGEVVRNLVAGTARAAHLNGANFLGSVSKWAIWIFAFLAALAQLVVAAAFVQTLFAGVVVALSLGFGLAFGLGGQDEASRVLKHMREQVTNGRGE